jgi:hypothetical protein
MVINQFCQEGGLILLNRARNFLGKETLNFEKVIIILCGKTKEREE